MTGHTLLVRIKALDHFSGTFNKAAGSATTMGSKIRHAGIVAAVGLTTLGIGIGYAVKEFMDAQKVTAQTNAVIKSTGGVANVSAKHVQDMADKLQTLSGVSDEEIRIGENMLLTFTNIRNEVGAGNDIFDQATTAVLDMSVAMGKDMKDTAILVGKALNDPIKGCTALRRVGVQLSDSQKKLVEDMMAAGDVMGAQKIILAELTKEFGGSAEAAGKTLAGKLSLLKNRFGDLLEVIGGMFMPVIMKVADAFSNFFQNLQSNTGVLNIIKGAASALGSALGFIGDHLNIIIPVVGTAVAAFLGFKILTTISGWITGVGNAFRGLTASVSGATYWTPQIGAMATQTKALGGAASGASKSVGTMGMALGGLGAIAGIAGGIIAWGVNHVNAMEAANRANYKAAVEASLGSADQARALEDVNNKLATVNPNTQEYNALLAEQKTKIEEAGKANAAYITQLDGTGEALGYNSSAHLRTVAAINDASQATQKAIATDEASATAVMELTGQITNSTRAAEAAAKAYPGLQDAMAGVNWAGKNLSEYTLPLMEKEFDETSKKNVAVQDAAFKSLTAQIDKYGTKIQTGGLQVLTRKDTAGMIAMLRSSIGPVYEQGLRMFSMIVKAEGAQNPAIQANFDSIMQGVRSKIDALPMNERTNAKMMEIVNAEMSAYGPVTGKMSELMSGVAGILSGTDLYNPTATAAAGIPAGITSQKEAALDAVRGIAGALADFMRGVTIPGPTVAPPHAHGGGLVLHGGGPVPSFQHGGYAKERLALLEQGEFVMQRSAVKKAGVQTMRAINEGKVAGDHYEININAGAYMGSPGEARRFAKQIVEYIDQEKGR